MADNLCFVFPTTNVGQHREHDTYVCVTTSTMQMKRAPAARVRDVTFLNRTYAWASAISLNLEPSGHGTVDTGEKLAIQCFVENYGRLPAILCKVFKHPPRTGEVNSASTERLQAR